MFRKANLRAMGLLLTMAFVASACAAPTPERIEVEVTKIVAGTPVVEKVVVTATPAAEPTPEPASAEKPVELHVGVSMTAVELQTWLPLFDKLDQDHPEWFLVLEQTPGLSASEKMAANVAAGTLPCVQEVAGLFVNPFIRQGAFLPLDDYIAESGVDMTDFWPRVMEEWTWEGKAYGIPLVAAPEILYFNKAMFDAAGLPYPTDDWTMDDLREAAIQLTLDAGGRNPTDPGFDPKDIKQWGFNASPASLGIWPHVYVEPWGGDFCADAACSQLSMTDPEDLQALNFWYDLVTKNHAGLYDPFSGAQTGVPGDPFIAERAATGYDGFFAIGVIRAIGAFDFGVRQPPQGPAGRSSALSTRGYTIGANCKYPDEAFRLIQELTSTEFLRDMWAVPGHSVPSRRSAAQILLEMQTPLDGVESVLATMEYGHGFRPNGPGAFEAYITTSGTPVKIFAGEVGLEEGYKQVEEAANEILAKAAGQ